ncbi:aldo/keto reductase [Microbacterium gorillae]|uniref:aldo/keto reductase n=1 Tax=Microbacterium gorillae TaxID=1231063 RepID=UPI00058D8F07|nr:aldo/keto reductase [Microbacterium gorillae]
MTDATAPLSLNTGALVPRLGFGTWQIPDDEVGELVQNAIAGGYRHIDTASGYANERGVGRGIAASHVGRDELFVTTKLNNPDQGHDRTLAAIDRSLELLGLDHVDLYLIHWPLQDDERLLSTWSAFEEILASGRARAIGVSNFGTRHLELLAGHSDVVPAVNQIELHPGFPQTELRAYHDAHGIITTSWSPLGGTSGSGWGSESRPNTVLTDPVITGIADAHGVTPAQAVIRWHLQHDLVVIPKSRSAQRIAENADVAGFALTDAEMAAIDGLSGPGRVGADPDTADFGARSDWR